MFLAAAPSHGASHDPSRIDIMSCNMTYLTLPRQSPAPSPGGLGDDEDDTDEEVDEQYLARMARATRRLNVRACT